MKNENQEQGTSLFNKAKKAAQTAKSSTKSHMESKFNEKQDPILRGVYLDRELNGKFDAKAKQFGRGGKTKLVNLIFREYFKRQHEVETHDQLSLKEILKESEGQSIDEYMEENHASKTASQVQKSIYLEPEICKMFDETAEKFGYGGKTRLINEAFSMYFRGQL